MQFSEATRPANPFAAFARTRTRAAAGAPFRYTASLSRSQLEGFALKEHTGLDLKEQGSALKEHRRSAAPKNRLPALTDRQAVMDALDIVDDDCPLPGHIHDGVAFVFHHWPDDDPHREDLRFQCNCYSHLPSRNWWYWRPPEDVYAALWTNGVLLPQQTIRYRFLWRLLLTHRVGLLAPEPVDLPPLDSARSEWPEFGRARELFALLMGLKCANGDHRPMPFVRGFVSDYLDIRLAIARDAIYELRAAGVIHKTDQDRRTYLYAPGDGTPDPTLTLRPC